MTIKKLKSGKLVIVKDKPKTPRQKQAAINAKLREIAKEQKQKAKQTKGKLQGLHKAVKDFHETTTNRLWSQNKFEDVIELTRNDNSDLYTFFAQQKLNDKIKAIIKKKVKDKKTGKLKLKYKGKVPVVRVKITSKKYKLVTTEFKIDDVKATYFLAGKRKGNKYTNKDMVAYYVHHATDNENVRLYAKETDGMRKRKHKINRKYKYAKKQKIEIGVRFVSKRLSKNVRGVDDRYKQPKPAKPYKEKRKSKK